jgi:predicted Zn-dependent protease
LTDETAEPKTAEPITAEPTKGLPVSSILMQGLIFLMAAVFFIVSVKRPDNTSLIPSGGIVKPINASSDLSVNSRMVLDDVAKMEPSKLLSEGKIDEAIGEARSELKAHPNDFRTVMCAGNVLSQVGDKDHGFELLKESVNLAPESRYVRLNYASRLTNAGRNDEAIQQYAILCDKFPKEWFEPHFELSRLYMGAGKPNEAIVQQKIVLDDQPDNPLVRQDMALCLVAAGKEDEAFDEFATSAKTIKDSKPYAVDARNILDKNRNPRRAIGDMRIEVATHKSDIKPRLEYVELLLYLGQNRDAKQAASEALRYFPKNIQLHLFLAEAEVKLGQNQDARQQFLKAAQYTFGNAIAKPSDKK